MTALAAELGESEATVQALLTQAGVSLGLGDLNGQPLDDTRVTGDAILAQAPVVNLVAGQTRAIGVQGDMTQEIRATSEFNQFGQLVRSVDPELNVHTVSYYPEADPDGDGVPVPGNTSTLLTGGYPSSAAADTELVPGRDSGLNPAPTLITSSQRYDAVGNVIEATDPRGIVHTFRVNPLNQVVGSTLAADTALLHPSEPGALAALGYESVVIYDANGNVVETRVENAGERTGDGVRVAANPFWAAKVAYDILDNPVLSLAEVEPVANDAALSVSSPGVIVSRVAYDKNENVQLVTKPEGNQLAYVYDERQLPFQVIDGFGSPEAGVYTYTYNANGSMVYAVDAEKNNPGKDPGVSGDVTRVHIDGFDETFCVWDAEGNFGLSVFDPTGARVRYVRFGPAEEGNPRLSEVEFLHDELGRRFQTEARIFTTQVTGGAAVMDFSIPVIGGGVPAGESEAIHLSEFDRLGRVIRGVSPDGDEALLDYDGASRLLRAQGPVFASRAGTGATRNEVSYAYNQASQVVRVLQTDRSPVQADETFEYLRVYDAVGRLVRSTDPVGHTSRLVYDSRSNVIAASDAQSSVLTGDPLGLFAGQINGHGNVVQVRYDGIGRPIQSDLALKVGGVGNGSLDLLGWTGLDTSNPANADGLITKRMRYDRNSRLLSQTDDNGNTTGSIYDARDRVTHSVAADMTARQVVYDRDSLVRRSIDRNGTVVSRSYDGLGRPMTAEVTKLATGLEGLAQNVEGTTLQAWEYDGLSRLRVAFDNNGPGADDVACSYTWDSLSRKTSERHRFNVLGGVTGATTTSGRVSVTPTGATLDRTVASQYDVDSNRVGLTYSSGRQLTFGIDGADRLQEISDGGGVIAGWEFVGGRPVFCGLRNGVQTNFGYDAKRRVTSIDHVGVVAFGYGWDRADRRTFETQSPGRTETYGYDSAYRVTSVGFSDGTPTTSYQIDGVGNWVTRVEGGETTEFNRRTNGSYAFDVMSEQFRTATYDQAGALVAENTPVSDPNGNRINDGDKKLVFDAFDRLLRVEDAGSGTTIATYHYDVAGRRTQKTTSSEDTYYVADGAREIEELAANGAVQADYVFGGYVDHVVQMRRGGGEYYLHQDSTFSVAAVTNAAGAVVTRYAYGSIYGTSSISAGSDVGNPWRFQGRRWDAESGFYQFRNRYLDPALGRFVSRDPIGIWGDTGNHGNGYAYCNNDPVNMVDPLGLWMPRGMQVDDYKNVGNYPQDERAWDARWVEATRRGYETRRLAPVLPYLLARQHMQAVGLAYRGIARGKWGFQYDVPNYGWFWAVGNHYLDIDKDLEYALYGPEPGAYSDPSVPFFFIGGWLAARTGGARGLAGFAAEEVVTSGVLAGPAEPHIPLGALNKSRIGISVAKAVFGSGRPTPRVLYVRPDKVADVTKGSISNALAAANGRFVRNADGLYIDAAGRPLQGTYKAVVTEGKDFRFVNAMEGTHGDLGEGAGVLAAGEFEFAGGVLKRADVTSGHYTPQGAEYVSTLQGAAQAAGLEGVNVASEFRDNFGRVFTIGADGTISRKPGCP